MALPDIVSKEVADGIIARIQKLSNTSQPQWGKMTVAQMLAHCNVTYEYIFEDHYKKPGGFRKLMLRLLVKPIVVGEKPYSHNSPTAPDFRISDERAFAKEQARLIDFISRTQQLGRAHFEGYESHSFGKLTGSEWNNMFYKHLDHHLNQFGV